MKIDASGNDMFEKFADDPEIVPATDAFDEHVIVPVTDRALIVAEPLKDSVVPVYMKGGKDMTLIVDPKKVCQFYH